MLIEKEANRIIMAGHKINKYFADKKDAEKDFGFTLYQGGVVPGNNLRIVQIEDTDVEACCGTHHDNTSNVGLIKMIKSHRISDGIVRLYFVAVNKHFKFQYERALDLINYETKILNDLCESWTVDKSQLIDTADKFFKTYKKAPARVKKLETSLIEYQVKFLVADNNAVVGYNLSDQEAPSVYYSNMGAHVEALHQNKKGMVFYNKDFVYIMLGSNQIVPESELREVIEKSKKGDEPVNWKVQTSATVNKKKVDILQMTAMGTFNQNALTDYFKTKQGFVKL